MTSKVENKDTLFTIAEVGEILGAGLEGAPGFRRTRVSGVKIDSRLVEAGDLFVAIKGKNLDGHDYLDPAFKNGAAAAVISLEFPVRPELNRNALLRAKDTVYALGEIARHHRNRMPAKVAAITGSNGKTTVKNLLYEIVSRKAPAVKSSRNYNNYYGLPLSIFQLRQDHKYAVLELGMSARGEISRLGEIASPDVAVITNVGPVHLQFFKNVEAIARAKLEILDRINPGGVLVINGDDKYLRNVKANGKADTIKFGLSAECDISPADLEFDASQFSSFKIDGVKFNVKMPGIHNVYNALAACSVAAVLDIDMAIVAKAIDGYKAEGMRSEIFEKSGINFFIDCYNANPVSMKYAIDTLSLMICRGKRIAVLGDMLELGEKSGAFHSEIGRYAKKAGLDHMLSLGKSSRLMTVEFGKNGEHFEEKTLLIARLKELAKKGDLILFKASRGMALEEVANRLMELI